MDSSMGGTQVTTNWKFLMDPDRDDNTVRWELDTHKMIRDLTDKMYGVEEKAFTEMVIKILRAKGYRIEEPDEQNR